MQFGVKTSGDPVEPLRFLGARGPPRPCFAKGLSNNSQSNAVSLQLVSTFLQVCCIKDYQGLPWIIKDCQGTRIVIQGGIQRQEFNRNKQLLIW